MVFLPVLSTRAPAAVFAEISLFVSVAGLGWIQGCLIMLRPYFPCDLELRP